MDKRSTSEEQKSGYLGLTRADEERHLADVISVAQQNLERAGADIRKVNEDLADLLETYDVKDKEGLALWNNATARLKENEYDLIRYEKARKKPWCSSWNRTPGQYIKSSYLYCSTYFLMSCHISAC